MPIRDAQLRDTTAIVDHNLAMAWETEHKALDRPTLTRGVERMLKEPRLGRYFVMEEAGALVGQLMITTEWSDWRDGHFWWIQSVYVVESARRRGVYRALHEHVLAEAERAGDVVGVRLYVEPDNARAQATYRKLGMKETYRVMEQPLAITRASDPRAPRTDG